MPQSPGLQLSASISISRNAVSAANITFFFIKMTNNQSFDEIEDSFTLSTSFLHNNSPSTSSSSLEKKTGGRLFSKVWEHVSKGKETSHGHYEGSCNYCKVHWKTARPLFMRQHLASHCQKAPDHVIQEFAQIVSTEIISNSFGPKRQKTNYDSKQTSLNGHFESTRITVAKQNDIDKSLIKAFVCCNISFSIVENPFFTELLKTLCPGYKLPSRRKLSIELLENEVARINLKMQQIFETSKNLTLGKYKNEFF